MARGYSSHVGRPTGLPKGIAQMLRPGARRKVRPEELNERERKRFNRTEQGWQPRLSSTAHAATHDREGRPYVKGKNGELLREITIARREKELAGDACL